ncbi:retinol dehydrogenase 12-like [Styela clava]
MVRSAVRGWVKSAVKLTNKTVLITGANSGLGYETALDLAKREARIIIACRDANKANAAKSEIEIATGSQKIITKSLDLASFDSIRTFAKDINQTETRLDILVNNAGVMKLPQGMTSDGFEMHFGVNHLGPFLLTNLLLDLITKNGNGRIVNLSSIAHLLGVLHWNDLNWRNKEYSPMGAYNASKLMNVLFTKELSRRVQGTGVTVNAVHPGVVRTNLNRTGGQDKSVYGRLTDFVFNQQLFTRDQKHGAQTSIYCAIAPELDGITGKYFSDCRRMFTKWPTTGKKNCERLWELSEELTELKTKQTSNTRTATNS